MGLSRLLRNVRSGHSSAKRRIYVRLVGPPHRYVPRAQAPPRGPPPRHRRGAAARADGRAGAGVAGRGRGVPGDWQVPPRTAGFRAHQLTPPQAPPRLMSLMKTIGLLGGMSWESTLPYYRLINQRVGERLGGFHSAKIVLYSVDFQEVEILQHEDRWQEAGELLAAAACSLERAGADFLVLCTNTMHKVAAAIERAVRIPLLHIADPTAAAVKAAGVHTIGLLGTRFTMEEAFYRERLRELHGLDVIVPDAADRDAVHRIIYDELCTGRVIESSRARYRRIVDRLVARGAGGIILGCTEISMLIGPADASVPTFDTTLIHARAAALRAMAAMNRPAPCEEPSG